MSPSGGSVGFVSSAGGLRCTVQTVRARVGDRRRGWQRLVAPVPGLWGWRLVQRPWQAV